MVSIKDVVRSSVNVPVFDKHLKKAGGHIGRNVVEITITIKMKTIVRKTLVYMLVNYLYLSSLSNYVLNKIQILPSRWRSGESVEYTNCTTAKG